ncbi:hypothetical protein F5876DRAFT_84296 [Lentinula aff. lateritia]|uniref:Uncharacterized protein n=1 Tax=Lentinula aff. lateritia TaxID=2804960 RepID=A0ACC1TH28_9AGAR|nr:hypothetical protein F5876DRAFT_84296 [Lentinula aff. lateritia]
MTLSKEERSALSNIPDIFSILLVPMRATIKQMIHHTLPVFAKFKSSSSSPHLLFSKEPSTPVTDADIRVFPIPHKSTVMDLIHLAPAKVSAGAQSVIHPHDTSQTRFYPLNMISFWYAAWLQHEQQEGWLNIEKWLLELCESSSLNVRSVAVSTLASLAEELWSLKKNGVQDGHPTTRLWRLLTRNCLDDTVLDSLLHLLHTRIQAQTELSHRFMVRGTHFVPSLTEAMRNIDDYRRARSWEWLRLLGHHVFVAKKILITVFNLRSNHWVPLIVDGELSVFRYGDSLTGDAARLIETLSSALSLWQIMHTV